MIKLFFLEIVAATGMTLAFAPASWACPGCIVGSIITPQMIIAANALSIWITVFVLGWYRSTKNPPARFLRLIVAAGLLSGAMPVLRFWVAFPIYIPLSWGTVIGFPILLVWAARFKRNDGESPFPVTMKQCILGLFLGMLAVQIFPIINDIIMLDDKIFYGKEYGRSISVWLLLCRPLPLIVLILGYWWKIRDYNQVIMMRMLFTLAILSTWLSFPLQELVGYKWYSNMGEGYAEGSTALSGLLLDIFRLILPAISLIPLVYAVICKLNRERLGLSGKTVRVLFIIGAIASVLSLIMTVN